MKKKYTSINLIPLIDILLVLLAIVLTTSTFIVNKHLPLNLPKAEGQTLKKQKELSINLRADGKLFVEKQPLSLQELKRFLHNKDKRTPLRLRCDEMVHFKAFVNLFSLCKDLGFQNLFIMTKT